MESVNHHKPFPAEVSRTIMELTSVGTLSTLIQNDAWPLGIGVRFAVDTQGTPILCLNDTNRQFSLDRRSSLHVQVLPSPTQFTSILNLSLFYDCFSANLVGTLCVCGFRHDIDV